MRQKVTALLALTLVLTGCDLAEHRDMSRERTTATYQAAMTDYKAGRLNEAIKGFRKVCRSDPANASARFQLACLLQETGKDYLGALCAYREYMDQMPDSEKSSLAKDRAAICEGELAKVLAEKHGLTHNQSILAELEDVKRKLKDADKRNVKLSDDVAVSMQRVAHLLEENAKLKAAIKGDAGEATALADSGLKDAKALLDEDDDDRRISTAEALKYKRERETGGDDRIANSADISRLRRELKADESLAESHSSLLPAHTSNTVRKVIERKPERKIPEPPHEKRPEVYVVQEGDTLYKIALRFYGRTSAWKSIREANKAVISTDGRVMKGMKLRLPEPKK